MSTIDPSSDSLEAKALHLSRKKTHCLSHVAAGLALLGLLGACQKAEEPANLPVEPEPAAEPTCSRDAYLSARLYGSIEREIRWSSEDLQCESMLRPDGKGVRLRFTGTAAGSRLAIILALPELQPGLDAAESPTVVTLMVEGSGRFFSTPTAETCWSDVSAHDMLDGSQDQHAISGTLYCVAPLGEINGDAAISIPEMSFRGGVDWSTK